MCHEERTGMNDLLTNSPFYKHWPFSLSPSLFCMFCFFLHKAYCLWKQAHMFLIENLMARRRGCRHKELVPRYWPHTLPPWESGAPWLLPSGCISSHLPPSASYTVPSLHPLPAQRPEYRGVWEVTVSKQLEKAKGSQRGNLWEESRLPFGEEGEN